MEQDLIGVIPFGPHFLYKPVSRAGVSTLLIDPSSQFPASLIHPRTWATTDTSVSWFPSGKNWESCSSSLPGVELEADGLHRSDIQEDVVFSFLAAVLISDPGPSMLKELEPHTLHDTTHISTHIYPSKNAAAGGQDKGTCPVCMRMQISAQWLF